MKIDTQPIVLEVLGKPIRLYLGPGVARVESELTRERCSRCGQTECGLPGCENGCEAPAEVIDCLRYNAILDAVESLILAHALAGVNVQAPGYVSGIETMLDAVANNL